MHANPVAFWSSKLGFTCCVDHLFPRDADAYEKPPYYLTFVGWPHRIRTWENNWESSRKSYFIQAPSRWVCQVLFDSQSSKVLLPASRQLSILGAHIHTPIWWDTTHLNTRTNTRSSNDNIDIKAKGILWGGVRQNIPCSNDPER